MDKEQLIKNLRLTLLSHFPDLNDYTRDCLEEMALEIQAHYESKWVRVDSGVLPEAKEVDGDKKSMSPVLAYAKGRKIAYYFPDRFKTIEWEDWDDYLEEKFPWTENDSQRGCAWLRAGWYYEIEDTDGNEFWSPLHNVTHWQPLPNSPLNEGEKTEKEL